MRGGLGEGAAVVAAAVAVESFGGRRPVIFHSCCSWKGSEGFREAGSAASTAGTGSGRTFSNGGHFHLVAALNRSPFLLLFRNLRLHFASP